MSITEKWRKEAKIREEASCWERKMMRQAQNGSEEWRAERLAKEKENQK